MATFYGLRKLGYTDKEEFTNYQGIGHEPLYNRYESIKQIVEKYIEPSYQGFLARPHAKGEHIYWYIPEWQELPKTLVELPEEEHRHYLSIKTQTVEYYRQRLLRMTSEEQQIMHGALRFVEDRFIYCYDNKVSLIAWGMTPNSDTPPIGGSWVYGVMVKKEYSIIYEAGSYGELESSVYRKCTREGGAVLLSVDIPRVRVHDGYRFTGWLPEPMNWTVEGDQTFVAQYEKTVVSSPVRVTFSAGEHGYLIGNDSIQCYIGERLSERDIPKVETVEGFTFRGWKPLVDMPIQGDTEFEACYEERYCSCHFDAGEHGSVEGKATIRKPFGTSLCEGDIPNVKPCRGYEFKGWTLPVNGILEGDYTATAQYEKQP